MQSRIRKSSVGGSAETDVSVEIPRRAFCVTEPCFADSSGIAWIFLKREKLCRGKESVLKWLSDRELSLSRNFFALRQVILLKDLYFSFGKVLFLCRKLKAKYNITSA